MSRPLDANSRRGRSGRPWRKLRARVIAEETHCCLCGRIVDKTLSGLHPYGPTIEHVIPLHKGGPALNRNNVRLAHRRCNVRHGNLTRQGKAWTPPNPIEPPSTW